MILIFGNPTEEIFAVQVSHPLENADIQKLLWLFGDRAALDMQKVSGIFIGPRATMITPWSTNAVEITQNMAIEGILRIEKYSFAGEGKVDFDPMLAQRYEGLDQTIFTINIEPAPILPIENIGAFNEQEGLALSQEEIQYLEGGIWISSWRWECG